MCKGAEAMFPFSRFLTVLIAAALPMLVCAEGRRPERDPLAPLQEASRELTRQVEYLQEDVVAELTAQKERALYRQADAVLAAIGHFQQVAKPGAAPAKMFKDYD